MQVYRVTDELKEKLAQKLSQHAAIFSYEEDSLLASMYTCMGLYFEMGRLGFDRLSPYFGVALTDTENPWLSEIVSRDGAFGLRCRLKNGKPLQARHPDLRYLLDPSSLDANGQLTHFVIFPVDVVRTFSQKGFELVIVRDWLLSSALNLEPEKVVPYLRTNPWEISNNIALTQVTLMQKRQLAFSGTHDISDHLLGADARRFDKLQDVFAQVAASFAAVFPPTSLANPAQLILSYLIGVLLDDVAQPKWYASVGHKRLIELSLQSLAIASTLSETPELPYSFHTLIEQLRSGHTSLLDLERSYRRFECELAPTTAAGC